MTVQLFLASTPLHILNSVAIASQTPDKQSCLWLIDQPNIDDNPYFDLLSDWQNSPFSDVRISQGHIKGTKAKLKNRKKVFADIQSWVKANLPAQIFTGNDRRIEFQYAMHCTHQLNGEAKGVYMDEGTFTYVGRQASASFSDRVIDNTLKKLTYGFWWKNPPTIGGSAWITDIYAAFPNLVHPELEQKQLHALQPLHSDNPIIADFCALLVRHFGADVESIKKVSVILTLPHESIICRLKGYREAMEDVLNTLTNKGLKVGIKYHPRNTDPDILEAATQSNAIVIPHRIPFEAILPLLPANIIIIGDLSSTLINSRWLRPSAQILSIKIPDAPLASEFESLFSQIGVASISADLLTEALGSALNQSRPT
jgi:hypothetical protein